MTLAFGIQFWRGKKRTRELRSRGTYRPIHSKLPAPGQDDIGPWGAAAAGIGQSLVTTLGNNNILLFLHHHLIQFLESSPKHATPRHATTFFNCDASSLPEGIITAPVAPLNQNQNYCATSSSFAYNLGFLKALLWDHSCSQGALVAGLLHSVVDSKSPSQPPKGPSTQCRSCLGGIGRVPAPSTCPSKLATI